jgi:hypothetical protein
MALAAFPPRATQLFDAFGISGTGAAIAPDTQEQSMATAKQRKAAQKNQRKSTKARSTARRTSATGGRKRSAAQKRAQRENLQKGRKGKGTIRKLLGL